MKSFLLIALLACISAKASAQSLSYSAAATSFAVGSTLLVASPLGETLDQKVIFDDCMDYYVSGEISEELENLTSGLRKDPRYCEATDEELIAIILDQLKLQD